MPKYRQTTPADEAWASDNRATILTTYLMPPGTDLRISATQQGTGTIMLSVVLSLVSAAAPLPKSTEC